jgi:hypothetical protein
MLNFSIDEDVAESSIFDLDHAPSPSTTHANLSSIVVPPPPPQPPSSSSFVSSTATGGLGRFGRSHSLSPHPPGLGGSRSRKSAIISGENHRLSVPHNVQHQHLPATTTRENASLSATFTAPISALHRRMSSRSTIPSVGGSNVYGQQYPLESSSASFASGSMVSTPTAGNRNPRRRALSAAAEFSTVPHTLSHVRSFPSDRHDVVHAAWSDAGPTTGTSVDDPVANSYGPHPVVGTRAISMSIDETKAQTDDEPDEMMEVENVLTDSDMDAGPVTHKQRADTITSDTGWSMLSSEQPPFQTSARDLRFVEPTDERLCEESGGGIDINNEDYGSIIVVPPKPIFLCGFVKLPLCFSKRRISWNRTYFGLLCCTYEAFCAWNTD